MRRIAAVLCLISAGCIFSAGPNTLETVRQFREERTEWQALKLRDYDFDYVRSSIWATDLARIQVRGGVVVGAYNTETGFPVQAQPFAPWPTIDEVYAMMDHQIRHEGYKLSITYNATFHFPSQVSGDIPGAIDDEYGMSLGDMVPLGVMASLRRP